VVQLGSFQQQSNARALERNVARVIPGAHVVQHGVMYRVRVGPYATREEAIEMRDRLEGAGFSGIVMAAGR
jgi:cell division protein FtsN